MNIRFFPHILAYNAEKEYSFNRILRQANVSVPEVLLHKKLSNGILIVRRYIEGKEFRDFMEEATPEEIRIVIQKLIEQLWRLEQLGIYIPEFSRLYRNVIITQDLKPYIIDIERASKSTKPIITKFLALIKRLSTIERYRTKLEKILEINMIDEAARQYKQRRDLSIVQELFGRKKTNKRQWGRGNTNEKNGHDGSPSA